MYRSKAFAAEVIGVERRVVYGIKSVILPWRRKVFLHVIGCELHVGGFYKERMEQLAPIIYSPTSKIVTGYRRERTDLVSDGRDGRAHAQASTSKQTAEEGRTNHDYTFPYSIVKQSERVWDVDETKNDDFVPPTTGSALFHSEDGDAAAFALLLRFSDAVALGVIFFVIFLFSRTVVVAEGTTSLLYRSFFAR